jgi:hypothetical protein
MVFTSQEENLNLQEYYNSLLRTNNFNSFQVDTDLKNISKSVTEKDMTYRFADKNPQQIALSSLTKTITSQVSRRSMLRTKRMQ